MIRKIHIQFGHASEKQLKDTLSNADCLTPDLSKCIEEVVSSCDTCLKCKKPTLRPVVGLNRAKTFNDVVAMDLKFIDNSKIIILHMIDMFSKYSRAVIVPSKHPEVIAVFFFSGILDFYIWPPYGRNIRVYIKDT